MRYPAMKGGAKYRVTVPQLNGGVNLCDGLTMVSDNQLTDSHNMWWHKNTLRTRPGLTFKQKGTLPDVLIGRAAYFVSRSPVNEREILLGQMLSDVGGAVTTFQGNVLDLERGITCLGKRTKVTINADGSWSCFGTKASKGSDTDYYFFLSDGSVLQQAEGEDDTPTLVDAQPYIPLVTVDGDGESGSDRVTYEGYNMLTGAFRCSYTTNGEKESFLLPQKELDAKHAVEISLTLTDGENVKDIAVTISPNDSGEYGTESLSADDGITSAMLGLGADTSAMHPQLTFSFNWQTGVLEVRSSAVYGEGDRVYKPLPFVTSNNLEITAHKAMAGQRDTICRMTRCTWFGGDRSGINGGSRLFVTGNPGKPNLVHWSDVNNPLYFPENNYAYVGSGDEAVTAFGKQGDLLIIFKTHEIYAAQYVAGADFTYDDVVSGAITDVQSHTAKFPLTPLHSAIGCDCPDSVRLVNNKLVWATSDGHVYMMPSVNQWSERNVRDITARIRPHLEMQAAADIRGAVAGEYKGYYTLLVNKTLYLLDTGNSAFQSYAYYASEKKASMMLPWYIWELDSCSDRWVATVSDGEHLYILKQPSSVSAADAKEWTLYALDGDTDDGEPIACSFTTKLFDFGRPDMYKSIKEMYIRAGNHASGQVRLCYVTEDGTYEDAYPLEMQEDVSLNAPNYIHTCRVSPNINRAELFGLRCESEGVMAIEGVQLNYSMQGVIR